MAKTKPIRLRDAAEQYLRKRSRLAPTTYYNDRVHIRQFVKTLGPDMWFAGVHPPLVEAYFYGDDSPIAGVKDSTFNTYRARISAFFKYAQRQQWTAEDLMAEVDNRKVVSRDRVRLSAQELLSAPDYAGWERDRAFIATAANTACRSAEIGRMRLQDVNLDERHIQVYISKTRQEDKVPVPSALDRELRRWLTCYRKMAGQPLDPEWYLFPAVSYVQTWNRETGSFAGSTGHRVAKPACPISQPNRISKQVLERMGIPQKGEGMHTFRRSFARVYFDHLSRVGPARGIDPLISTMRLLHHATPEMTLHYIGYDREGKFRDEMLAGTEFLELAEQIEQPRLGVVESG